jgi:hypothetical protein
MQIRFQPSLCCVVAFFALTLNSRAQPTAQDKGGLDATGPYQVVQNWFKPAIERWNQPVTGVAVDTSDRIFVVSSGQQISRPFFNCGRPVKRLSKIHHCWGHGSFRGRERHMMVFRDVTSQC